MAYTDIQFISYEIYTGPTIAAKNEREYKGMPSDMDDMSYRVTLMTEAIECARKAANTDKNCLKIFVAPEFYFRGRRGVYPIAKVAGEGREDRPTSNLLDMLRTAVKTKNGDYADWLFVFGSIIASSEGPKPFLRSARQEAYNICLIHRGERGIEGSRVVVKEHKSPVDFLKVSPADGAVLDSVARHLAAGKKSGSGWDPNRGAGKEFGGKEYEGLGIFEIEGITFGLEVCLDHARGRLRQSPPGPKEPWVQLQLVPSCGMQVNPPSVVTCKDGFVFNVDGSYMVDVNDKPTCVGHHSQLKQVTAPFKTIGSATLKAVPPLAPGYPHAAPGRISLVFDDLTKVFKNRWDFCRPRVRVFPKQAIPQQPQTARPGTVVWEKDSAHSSCQRCSVKFTLTTRRHHCRACGRVLCSTCAPQNLTLGLSHLGYEKLERVCKDCYFQYTGKLVK